MLCRELWIWPETHPVISPFLTSPGVTYSPLVAQHYSKKINQSIDHKLVTIVNYKNKRINWCFNSAGLIKKKCDYQNIELAPENYFSFNYTLTCAVVSHLLYFSVFTDLLLGWLIFCTAALKPSSATEWLFCTLKKKKSGIWDIAEWGDVIR